MGLEESMDGWCSPRLLLRLVGLPNPLNLSTFVMCLEKKCLCWKESFVVGPASRLHHSCTTPKTVYSVFCISHKQHLQNHHTSKLILLNHVSLPKSVYNSVIRIFVKLKFSA